MIPLPHEELAGPTGKARATVNAALNTLRDAGGLVTSSRGRTTIHDVGALAQRARADRHPNRGANPGAALSASATGDTTALAPALG